MLGESMVALGVLVTNHDGWENQILVHFWENLSR